MSRRLKYWIEIELQQRQLSDKRIWLVRDILAEFEAAGEVFRRRGRRGHIVWKPSKKMVQRLADAVREAKADLADEL